MFDSLPGNSTAIFYAALLVMSIILLSRSITKMVLLGVSKAVDVSAKTISVSDWFILEDRFIGDINRWLSFETTMGTNGTPQSQFMKEILVADMITMMSGTTTGAELRELLFRKRSEDDDDFIINRIVGFEVIMRASYPKEFIDSKIGQMFGAVNRNLIDKPDVDNIMDKTPFIWIIPFIQYAMRYDKLNTRKIS